MPPRPTTSSIAAPTRPSRSFSNTTDVLVVTAGDPSRRTGGNIYLEHVVTGLRRARVTTETLALRDRASTPELQRTDASVIVVDTIAAALAASSLSALRRRGKRVVALALMQQGAPRLCRHADVVVVPSDALASDLAALGIPRARITVIRPGREALPAEAAAGDGKLRILCVANWSPAKGIHTLLEAASSIPDAVIDLVGDAPVDRYADRVRRIAARPSLAKRVRIRGTLRGAALKRRYARATIFALPSTRESYGMAVAEALGHGLPVVACDIPATREVTNGAAMLVAPGDVGGVRDALRDLVASERRREVLGRKARARARRLPTWVEMEVGILELVEGLLEKAPSARGAGARRTRAGRPS